MKQKGLFDEEDRLRVLSKLGDSLEKLNEKINWEIFKPLLKKALTKEPKGLGGRPAYDYVMMFKIIILQKLYNISDDQTEYQINDRLSFMRFLGLELKDKVPDAKTIWLFKEKLIEARVSKKLFEKFGKELAGNNLIGKEGTIIDATIVEAPIQHNSKDENEQIKNGKIPEQWQEKQNKAKLSQKDCDARWTKKNKRNYYGYKDHIKIDKKSKLILKATVTAANVHDSRELKNLVEREDKSLYADSAYIGEEIERILKTKGIEGQICERGARGKPLTKKQKIGNRKKSKIRARVEHVFGFMTNSMKGIYVRTIGLARATFSIIMMNLTYNLCRYCYLKK
ncbi:IS5 family transposase [Treponema phagedenis]|uniref:IS5 family transposase n=1 Tax=Treponema phagedenis TaxID=162 RepID=UPI0011E6386C|nr:IS5 family transposase [Treponema phagedenis]QEK04260.1 IS5 family transposase [Treponema phagedenis]